MSAIQPHLYCLDDLILLATDDMRHADENLAEVLGKSVYPGKILARLKADLDKKASMLHYLTLLKEKEQP